MNQYIPFCFAGFLTHATQSSKHIFILVSEPLFRLLPLTFQRLNLERPHDAFPSPSGSLPLPFILYWVLWNHTFQHVLYSSLCLLIWIHIPDKQNHSSDLNMFHTNPQLHLYHTASSPWAPCPQHQPLKFSLLKPQLSRMFPCLPAPCALQSQDPTGFDLTALITNAFYLLPP